MRQASGARRICFVCLGNICRSPTAEGVFEAVLADSGRTHEFELDSAGTSAHHEGERADPRSREAASRRGYELRSRSRPFRRRDFAAFDLVVAMDAENRRALLGMAPDEEGRAKVVMLRAFDPEAPEGAEVPDPYYGGAGGFDDVLDICERACNGLLSACLADETR